MAINGHRDARIVPRAGVAVGPVLAAGRRHVADTPPQDIVTEGTGTVVPPGAGSLSPAALLSLAVLITTPTEAFSIVKLLFLLAGRARNAGVGEVRRLRVG